MPAPRNAGGGGHVTAAERPRSLLPQDRDPNTWHPLQDGCARLYRLIRPGETFAGMTVTVIDGRRTVRLVLDKDGDTARGG